MIILQGMNTQAWPTIGLLVLTASFTTGGYAACIDQVKSKSERLLRNFSETVQYPDRDPVAQLDHLQRAEQRLLKFIDGDWASACVPAKAYLNNARQEQLSTIRGQASRQTLARCQQHLQSMTVPFASKHDQALVERDGASLIAAAEALEAELSQDRLLPRCPGFAQKINNLRSQDIAAAKALGQQMANVQLLDHYYPGIEHTWALTSTALTKQRQPGPAYLTTDQGLRQFGDAIKTCIRATRQLQRAGIDRALRWQTSRPSLSLGATADLCVALQGRLQDLQQRVQQHNDRFDKEQRADWERHHVPTSAMRKVYLENHPAIPEIEPNATEGPVWHYRQLVARQDFHQCRSYYFDVSGKRLRDLRLHACD